MVFGLQNLGIFVGFMIVACFSKFADQMFPDDGCGEAWFIQHKLHKP